jgi:hypothetical protein
MIPLAPEQSWPYLILTFFLPPLIALVKQAGFSPQLNAIIAQAVYIVVGIGAAIWSGIPVTVENAVPLIATATVVGSAAYRLIWANIGDDGSDGAVGLDERITNTTSVVK